MTVRPHQDYLSQVSSRLLACGLVSSAPEGTRCVEVHSGYVSGVVWSGRPRCGSQKPNSIMLPANMHTKFHRCESRQGIQNMCPMRHWWMALSCSPPCLTDPFNAHRSEHIYEQSCSIYLSRILGLRSSFRQKFGIPRLSWPSMMARHAQSVQPACTWKCFSWVKNPKTFGHNFFLQIWQNMQGKEQDV